MDWGSWMGKLQGLLEKAPDRARRSRPVAGPGRSSRLDCWSGQRMIQPLGEELRLYQEMRRTFPLLDVAVTRLVQLCGHPGIEGATALREELEGWMRHVPVGPAQRGLGGWVETQLDRMLVAGYSVGFIRLTPTGRDVGAVLSPDLCRIRLEALPDDTKLRVLRQRPGRLDWEEANPALTLLSLRAPDGAGCGTSLLRSLPFVAEACSIIENATAQVWQRMGAPSFHVNWGEKEALDGEGTAGGEILDGLEQSFTDMMQARRRGEVKDWFTSGAVKAELLGSPGQLDAVQESFRIFAEQMVSATGLPPWLLGLHWSATERLSVQQADLLVANIEGLRRELQPQLEYLLEVRQRLSARPGSFRVTWPPVNLRDATEQARAEAWREQGRQRRIENARRMWELGFWSQERAAREIDSALVSVDRKLAAPPPASSSTGSGGALTPAG